MKPPSPESPSFFSQLGPILFLTTIFFLNFIGRIVFAPLMPSIENNLGLDHTEAGSMFLLISLGYFISLLGSGFLSCRLTHRKTIIISINIYLCSLHRSVQVTRQYISWKSCYTSFYCYFICWSRVTIRIIRSDPVMISPRGWNIIIYIFLYILSYCSNHTPK